MIYADCNGTTPLLKEVREFLKERIDLGPYGNPNALHALGRINKARMEKSRKIIADYLDCSPAQIIFTSGATESINTIFQSIIENEDKKKIIITSPIEHKAIHNICNHYVKTKGFIVKMPSVHQNGVINMEDVEKLLTIHKNDIACVAIMASNNETGVLQPFEKIAEYCSRLNIKYISDTTQYIGKVNFSFDKSKIDYAMLSGHKLGALLGTGCLIAKDINTIRPSILGAGQENNLRGGTQNYIGIETVAIALDSIHSHKKEIEEIEKNRNNFENKLIENFSDIKIFGKEAARVPTTSFLAFKGIFGQALQIELESREIYVSTSAACSDNEAKTSKTLEAMGICDDFGRGAIRIGLNHESPQNAFDKIFSALSLAHQRLKKIDCYSQIK